MKLTATAVILLIVAFHAKAQTLAGSQSSAQCAELSTCMSEWQKNPGDNNVRQRILQIVAGMDPKPKVPGEAAEHEGKAEYLFKNAQNVIDFQNAATEYESAANAAPWISRYYFNAGKSWERAALAGISASFFDAAIREYKLYLLVAPDASDAADVSKRIGELEIAGQKKKEQNAKDAANAEVRSFQRKVEGHVFRQELCSMDGRTDPDPGNKGCTFEEANNSPNAWHYRMQNNEYVWRFAESNGYLEGRLERRDAPPNEADDSTVIVETSARTGELGFYHGVRKFLHATTRYPYSFWDEKTQTLFVSDEDGAENFGKAPGTWLHRLTMYKKIQ